MNGGYCCVAAAPAAARARGGEGSSGPWAYWRSTADAASIGRCIYPNGLSVGSSATTIGYTVRDDGNTICHTSNGAGTAYGGYSSIAAAPVTAGASCGI